MNKSVIYLHPHFTMHGGAGRFVLETGRRLAAQGIRVTIISIRSEESVVGEYRHILEFIDIGGPLSSNLWFWLTFPWSCFKVFRILRKRRDYILFPQVFPANWWGGIYKMVNRKTRLVWMCQEPSAFIHSREWIASIKSGLMRLGAVICNPFLKMIDIRLASLPDEVIANSEYTRRQAQHLYKYATGVIRTVYPGVENQGRRVKSIEIGAATSIITVGRLTKFKNIDKIIQMVKLLTGHGHQVSLDIVGGGEETESLKYLAATLGLEGRVRFHGGVDGPTLSRLYSEAQVYVSAAAGEPFGLTLLEAMSWGLPVVAVNSGGPAEIISSGVSGLLVAEGTPDRLFDAVRKLILDPVLYQRMSGAACQRAGEFGWDRTTDGIIKILEGKFA